MELTQESLTNLLIAKKKIATCVARTNGKIVKTRRCEGGKVNVYNTYTEDYVIPYFFNPLHRKIKTLKSALLFFDKKMGNLKYE